MSYEVTPVLNPNASSAAPAAEIMREPREFDPYKKKIVTTPPVPRETTGQTGISAEKSVTEVSAPPAETVTLSPQVAALARKEQAYRRNEQELKTKAAALEAERAEIAELKALKAKLANKDFSGIEDLVKYDDYTQYLIDKQEATTPEQIAVKKLEQEVEGIKKAHSEDVSKRFEAAVQERRKAVTSLVETNEEFSSIKELKMQEAVVQHILDTWENDQIDLSPEEAAKEVEAELVERAGRWSALPKLKAKVAPVEDSKNLPPLKPQLKTLTNNMAATGEIKRPVKSFQNMTDSERYAEARRRAEEKLKQRG